jgi:hypothetical protein
MIKEIIELIVGYPFWVKIAIGLLAASILFLLVAFRPPTKEGKEGSGGSDSAASNHIFRIEKIESSRIYKLISLTVSINGYEHRFPSGYEYAAYEQNMSGGEYPMAANATEFLVIIRARIQIDEDYRPSPTMPMRTITITKELQLRQPLRFLTKEFPKQGMETLRAVEYGVQSAPREYDILVHYSVK